MAEATRNMRAWGWSALAAALVLATASPAAAIINPDYTPVDLVKQSDLILALEVGPPGEGGEVSAKVVAVLEGKAPEKLALRINRAEEVLVREVREAFAGKETAEALLFAGDFSGAASEDPAVALDKPVGALYVGLTWFWLLPQPDGGLRLGHDQAGNLKAVWAGGNRMLQRVIAYVKADTRAELPVVVGIKWGADVRAGDVAGPVSGCLPVDLGGPGTASGPLAGPAARPGPAAAPGGKLVLHVLAEGGDRIFQPSGPSAFDDATGRLGLAARSKCAAWGDFSGDGRLDLASWDGKALVLHLATEGGTFEAKPAGVDLPQGCIGLAALDVGAGRRAGLLVSTAAAPVLLVPQADGSFAKRALAAAAGEFAGKDLGQAGPCVAADFDGDAIVDVLQPLQKGVLFYKGRKAGEFEPPATACEQGLGEGLSAAFAGDYDADGLLDVWVTAKPGCSLLQNLGGGRFREVFKETGEVEYKSQPQTCGGAACDLNNDGRQELILLYPKMGAQFFFSRGFQCFGHALELELAESELEGARACSDGQQAGTVADFDGDGAQDVALVSQAGEVWVLQREAEQGSRLGLTVALPAGAAGPVNVVAYDAARCLGAQAVAPGSPAFFGKRDKGPLTLKWRPPGGKEREERVIVLKATRFELPLDGEGPGK